MACYSLVICSIQQKSKQKEKLQVNNITTLHSPEPTNDPEVKINISNQAATAIFIKHTLPSAHCSN